MFFIAVISSVHPSYVCPCHICYCEGSCLFLYWRNIPESSMNCPNAASNSPLLSYEALSISPTNIDWCAYCLYIMSSTVCSSASLVHLTREDVMVLCFYDTALIARVSKVALCAQCDPPTRDLGLGLIRQIVVLDILVCYSGELNQRSLEY